MQGAKEQFYGLFIVEVRVIKASCLNCDSHCYSAWVTVGAVNLDMK